jgi:hypothetical protein
MLPLDLCSSKFLAETAKKSQGNIGHYEILILEVRGSECVLLIFLVLSSCSAIRKGKVWEGVLSPREAIRIYLCPQNSGHQEVEEVLHAQVCADRDHPSEQIEA